MNNPREIPLQDPDAELIDLGDLLRTFGRYKWSVLFFGVLGFVFGGLAAAVQDKIYEATATVLIEVDISKPVPVRDQLDDSLGWVEHYSTQFALIKSRELAKRVIKKLNLTESEEFARVMKEPAAPLIDWREWLPFLQPEEKPAADPERLAALRLEAVTDEFVNRVTVMRIGQTQLAWIKFKSYSPQAGAEIVNVLADTFIESDLQARIDSAQKANQWLTDKMGDVRGELEKAERALQQFREQEEIVDVGGTRSFDAEELLDANERLREAERRKTELASAYSAIQQAGNDPSVLQGIPRLLSDQRVLNASREFMEAQAAVKTLRERYGDRHPQMTTALGRLEGARAAYTEQLRIAAAGIKSEYEIAAQNERALAALVNSARNQMKKLDKKQYELSVLEREAAASREFYNLFLTRLKASDSVESYQGLSARVVDPAVAPLTPSEPRPARTAMIGGLLGLVLGVLLALLRHLLSEQIRSPDELERLTQAPVLGVLPAVAKADRAILASYFVQKPKTPYAEGIRSVRTALQLSDVDRKYHRILITSSLPQEGKSSVACSLAMAFAAMEKTLLIDADLRRPSLEKALSIPSGAPGLTELLAGQAKLEQCLHLHKASGVHVLPAGRSVPNPGEVLASQGFKNLIAELSKEYQRMVFDSPPCQAAADALQLSELVDGVLFLVKSEATSSRAVKNAYKLLRGLGAPVLGNIVNQVDVKKNAQYLQGYYYAYGYYG